MRHLTGTKLFGWMLCAISEMEKLWLKSRRWQGGARSWKLCYAVPIQLKFSIQFKASCVLWKFLAHVTCITMMLLRQAVAETAWRTRETEGALYRTLFSWEANIQKNQLRNTLGSNNRNLFINSRMHYGPLLSFSFRVAEFTLKYQFRWVGSNIPSMITTYAHCSLAPGFGVDGDNENCGLCCCWLEITRREHAEAHQLQSGILQ